MTKIFSTSIQFAGRDCIQMDDRKYPQAAGKANSFRCPLGRNPGVGWVLMLRSELKKIQNNRNLPGALVMRGGETLKIPSLYMSSAIKVSGGPRGDANAVFLVKLVDKRALFALSASSTATAGSGQYNVRYAHPPDKTGAEQFYLESLDSSALWTWQGVLNDLWAKLPAGANPGDPPELPYEPDELPEGLRFIGVSAWDAICQMLDKLGCAITYNPIADRFWIVWLGTTQVFLQDRLKAYDELYLDDIDGLQTQATEIPEKVRVCFHTHYRFYGNAMDHMREDGESMAPLVAVDVESTIQGAIPGTVAIVWDDLPALYDHTPSLENAAALETRAAQLAGNYIASLTVSGRRFRRLYSGIRTAILPGSQIKVVSWRDRGPKFGGVTTEIACYPGQPIETDSAMASAWLKGESLPPAERLMRPDFGRRTHTHYPKMLLGKLAYDAEEDGSALVDLWHHDGTDWVESGHQLTVWPWLEHGNPTKAGQKCIIGRFDDSQRWVFLCCCEGGGILFTLLGDLAGGTATATVDLSWGHTPTDVDGVTGGVQVVVNDDQALFVSALTGAKGIAIWDADNEKYHVVECQSVAGWVRFTLLGPLSGGSATATADAWAGSQQDIQQPDAVITVYDDAGLFIRALSGAKGLAFYNAILGRYNVVECQSQAGWVIATVTGDTLSGATVTDFGGTQQDVQEPGAITLVDPLELLDIEGASSEEENVVFAIYDNLADQYVIVAVKGGGKIAIRFTLTEDWVAGPIDAELTGTAPPIAVEVHDEQELFRRALDGAAGVAVWNHREKRWEIAECESQAGFVNFVLDENMAPPTTATGATLPGGGRFWGTQQDAQDPDAVFFEVHDISGLFQHALEGADGIATLDKATGKYNVIQCDQAAYLIMAELSAKLEASDLVASVNNFTAMTFKPFSQIPDLTEADNTLKLMGCEGDKVVLAATGGGSYMVLNIEHKTTDVVVDNNVDEENMELEHKRYSTAIIHNVDCTSPPPDFEPYHVGTDCAEEEV